MQANLNNLVKVLISLCKQCVIMYRIWLIFDENFKLFSNITELIFEITKIMFLCSKYYITHICSIIFISTRVF